MAEARFFMAEAAKGDHAQTGAGVGILGTHMVAFFTPFATPNFLGIRVSQLSSLYLTEEDV